MRKKIAGVLFALMIGMVTSGLSLIGSEQVGAAGSLPSAILMKEVSPASGAEVTPGSGPEVTQAESPSPSNVSSAPKLDVSFTAQLQFSSAMDDHVILELTNQGSKEMRIAAQGHYMDQIGSAGSWDCGAQRETIAGPGETVYVDFYTAQAVAHGENSILAFYIQYENQWFLAKVGELNGVECFSQHD